MRKIGKIQETKGRYTLNKTRKKEEYVITSNDIKEMAMQQEGNKILDVLNDLSTIIKGKEQVEIER